MSRVLCRGAAALVLVLAAAGSLHAEPFSERDVRFANGPVELAGTFMTPAGDGPRPAVVFLHGSGPATRDGAREYAGLFAELGVASLFFDKRGAGESQGSWLTSSLDDLAGDARAAVEFVKDQRGVDPSRIGLWGVSQAAWVATIAASANPDVGFLVLISGGGVRPRESELFSYARAFERAGVSEASQAKAFRVIDEYLHYLGTGEGRPAVVAAVGAARDSEWYPHARLDRILPSEAHRSAWSWVAAWDPMEDMARIRCPVLLLFGDRDRDHPTELAVKRWREGLSRAGNENVTTVVFPGAGHGIRMRDDHTGPGRAPFAEGYTDIMVGWMWRHVVSAD